MADDRLVHPERGVLLTSYHKLAEQLTAEALLDRAYSAEQRAEFAKKGWALPDGSYPIANMTDLRNAMQAYGRSNPEDRAKVKRHLTKRAKDLGAPEEMIQRISEYGK